MGVPTLAAGEVENARTDRKGQQVDQASDFPPIPLEREGGSQLFDVVRVKVPLPPLASAQKKTGSR
jgi:hypothetical protein